MKPSSGLGLGDGLGDMGLIGGLGGDVDRRLGAWAGDVEAGGAAQTGQWGLGRSKMGLGVGRQAGSVEQVGGEGAGRQAEG